MTDLGAALVAARKAMKDPRKSGDNPHFRSKFVPRDEVLDAIMEPLLSQGLFLSQGIFDGNMVTTVTLGVTSMRLGEYPIAPNSDAQKYLAACTYASRGSLMLAFGLAGDEDDDGNTAAAKPAAKSEATPDPERKNAKPRGNAKQQEHDAAILADYKKLMAEAAKHEDVEAPTRLREYLGNPSSGEEALAAYTALSPAKRAGALVIAGGGTVVA